MDWDVFISHASEDKEAVARPLAASLQELGLRVWFDETSPTLRLGDSLRRSIDKGLSRSSFGIVIISPAFLKKREWPQRELDGLVAREIAGEKVILPIWHRVNAEMVRSYSPTLADRLSVSTDKGIPFVAKTVYEVVRHNSQRTSPYNDGLSTALSSEPNLTRNTQSIVYCRNCGAMPGQATKCASGYVSHTFVEGATNKTYCRNCGAMPGQATKCASGYVSHTFVSS